jgi:thiosulfate/3-mercaptopyruvate sulfurtransferase
MDTLVTTDWLSQHLDDPDLVVLDCTVRTEPGDGGGFTNVSGRADYDGGHIPSAGFADLTGDLSDSNSPIEFAVPTPERFCSAMGALGVGDDSRVVLYDGYLSAWAARVWWGRFRPGGASRRWIEGLDRRGSAAFDRASHPTFETAHPRSPTGSDRRPSRGARCHQ